MHEECQSTDRYDFFLWFLFLDYVHYMKQSAPKFSDEGHFNVAASTYKEAADTMFQSLEYESALELYKLAVDIMSIEDDSKM